MEKNRVKVKIGYLLQLYLYLIGLWDYVCHPTKKEVFDLEILFSIKKFCLGFLRRNTEEILNEKLHFLCNLCDKTNSKSKYRMKQKFSIVWSCCPNKFFMEIPASGFRSVILCSNLKMMHAKRGYHALTQRITIVKIFMEYKKVLLLLNLPQIQEAQCEMLWSLRSF